MPTPVNLSVVYCSSTGAVHTNAEAVAEHAERAGAGVRLCKAHEPGC
ncbi:hypothetical protein [Streptomyces chengmaiensis]